MNKNYGFKTEQDIGFQKFLSKNYLSELYSDKEKQCGIILFYNTPYEGYLPEIMNEVLLISQERNRNQFLLKCQKFINNFVRDNVPCDEIVAIFNTFNIKYQSFTKIQRDILCGEFEKLYKKRLDTDVEFKFGPLKGNGDTVNHFAATVPFEQLNQLCDVTAEGADTHYSKTIYKTNLKLEQTIKQNNIEQKVETQKPIAQPLTVLKPIAQQFKETRKSNWGEKQKSTSIVGKEEEKKRSNSRSVVQRDERSGSRIRDSKFTGMGGVIEKRGASGQRTLEIGNLAVHKEQHPTSFGAMSKSLKEKQKASTLTHTDQLKKQEESLNKKFGGMSFNM